MAKAKKRKLRKKIPIFAFIIVIIVILIVAILLPFLIIYKLGFQKDWNNFQKDFSTALPNLESRVILNNPVATLTNSKLKSTRYYRITYEDIFKVENNPKGTILTVDFEANFSKNTTFDIDAVVVVEKWNTKYSQLTFSC